jgi:hypothetical protein
VTPASIAGVTRKRAMNPTEVVISKSQAERSPVMFPFLTEAVREPSESADAHSHAQVLTLDMRSADAFRIGIAAHCDYLRINIRLPFPLCYCSLQSAAYHSGCIGASILLWTRMPAQCWGLSLPGLYRESLSGRFP